MGQYYLSPEDQSFGPQYPGRFDFTLAFEDDVLTIIPAALFIAATLGFIGHERRKVAVVGTGWLFWSKMVCGCYLFPKCTLTKDTACWWLSCRSRKCATGILGQGIPVSNIHRSTCALRCRSYSSDSCPIPGTHSLIFTVYPIEQLLQSDNTVWDCQDALIPHSPRSSACRVLCCRRYRCEACCCGTRRVAKASLCA